MILKKIFFPVGGGEELEERIFGALVVAKHFNTHMEILLSQARIGNTIPQGLGIQPDILKKIEELHKAQLKEELDDHKDIFSRCCAQKDIKISDLPQDGKATAHLTTGVGIRSDLVAQQSKFCDMVVAATPPRGIATATFEASVLQSGKPVLVIPRKMTEFKTDNILIGWNNSPQASRAVSEAIGFMKNAKRVHIVSSAEYTTKTRSRIRDLRSYLEIHEIETTFELVKTTFRPGEALLKSAQSDNFDLIVAGAYGHKGFKEMMFGGTSKYLLEHTTIPTLMSH